MSDFDPKTTMVRDPLFISYTDETIASWYNQLSGMAKLCQDDDLLSSKTFLMIKAEHERRRAHPTPKGNPAADLFEELFQRPARRT
jgi:hypothetical protein